jgi:glycosyltransferase involved in cell wall biosynthesis
MINILLISNNDIGNLSTPRWKEIYYILTELNQKRNQALALVRNTNNNIPNIIAPIPFGNKIPMFLSTIERIIPQISTRICSEKLFDFFCCNEIKKLQPKIIYFLAPGLTKCIKYAKRNEIKVILNGNIGHPDTLKKILKTEEKILIEKNIINKPLKSNLDKLDDINRFSFENADNIFAKSNFVKKTCIDNGIRKNKIKLIGNGVDIKRYTPNKKLNNTFRVIIIANMSIRKGLYYLLEAWKELNLKNAELIICGLITLEVKPIIKYYNMNSVKYVGFKDPLNYIHKSDLFVMPSLFEGSPLAALEAMSCGLPVIMFENSGSLARNNVDGFIIKNRDIKTLKEKILFMYKNRKVMKTMGLNAREQAKKYSLENYSKNIVKLINKIL